MNLHTPTPHQDTLAHKAGVRCSCGVDFSVGNEYPWSTKTGTRSKRKVVSMKQAWEQYRAHWLEATTLSNPDVA